MDMQPEHGHGGWTGICSTVARTWKCSIEKDTQHGHGHETQTWTWMNTDTGKCIYQRHIFRGSKGQFRIHLIKFGEISIQETGPFYSI
jgi:hypothetical protein